MKITIDIHDAPLREAGEVAKGEGVTLAALVERGLRTVTAEIRQNPRFKLRRASFKGDGLHPELRDASGEAIRDLANEGRGS
jgi:hypothetical protein